MCACVWTVKKNFVADCENGVPRGKAAIKAVEVHELKLARVGPKVVIENGGTKFPQELMRQALNRKFRIHFTDSHAPKFFILLRYS